MDLSALCELKRKYSRCSAENARERIAVTGDAFGQHTTVDRNSCVAVGGARVAGDHRVIEDSVARGQWSALENLAGGVETTIG